MKLNDLIKEIELIYNTFKKNPNRIFSVDHLTEKENSLEILNENFILIKQKLLHNEKDDTNLKLLESRIEEKEIIFRNYIEKINSFIKINKEKVIESETKMNFNLLEANKLIPQFNGDISSLNNFLNLIEIYSKLLKDEEEVKKLISFIYATKLNDVAKRKLSSINEETKFQEFKTSFIKTFSSTRSPLAIQNILNSTKQVGTLDEFIENIQKLVEELNYVQTQNKSDIEKNVIRAMNNDLALSAFKNGIKFELKGVIFAARPKNFEEARVIATELDTSLHTSSERNVSFTQRGGYTTSRSRGRYRNYSQRSRGKHGYNNQNQRNKYQNSNSKCHCSQNYRGQSKRSQRGNKNKNYNNRNSNVKHVEADEGNSSAPDPQLADLMGKMNL